MKRHIGKIKVDRWLDFCNDYNLIIPDNVLVHLFEKFEEKFGQNYQDRITKTSYKNNLEVRSLIFEIIENFDYKIMYEMELENFVKFKYASIGDSNRLVIEIIE